MSVKRAEAPHDPRETELFDTLVMDSMEYVHGIATEEIVKILENSTDTTRSIATIVYKSVRGVAEKNQASAQIEMDMDMMMGLTAETIEMVGEIAEAAGQVPKGINTEQMRHDAMLRVAVLHGEQLEAEGFTDEQRRAAETDLRDYMMDEGMDKAFTYVNDRAKSEGTNPADMKRVGNEMVYGSRRPLTDAVKFGLDQQQPPPLMAQNTDPGMDVVPEGMDNYQNPDPGMSVVPEGMDNYQNPDPGMDVMPQPLMGGPGTRTPEQQSPLPRGEGMLPSGTGLPPLENPNPPPPDRMPRGRR